MIREAYRMSAVLCVALLAAMPGMAQKKVLDHSVYDTWKSLSNIEITNDGKYSVAIVKEQEGDDYLLIRNLKSQKELMLPRGYTYTITPDQKYVVAQIKAPYAVTRQAKIKKTADEKLPKDSLAIISLDKFTLSKIPNVKSYKLGKDYSDYIAYTLDDTIKVKDKKDVKAYSLIFRNLYSAKEDTIKHATEYVFSRNGKSLATILKPNAKDTVNKAGVLFINLSTLDKKTVSTGKTTYKNVALSESGSKLTFLATADSIKKEIKEYGLFYFDATLDSAMLMADKSTSGMPDKWSVSENYSPVFSKDEK
ncbi:MAG: S9 family peptidase, partial [Prevotella sp.]|nr:S9 family peptidase [Prevotella sp.]